MGHVWFRAKEMIVSRYTLGTDEDYRTLQIPYGNLTSFSLDGASAVYRDENFLIPNRKLPGVKTIITGGFQDEEMVDDRGNGIRHCRR